MQDKKCGHDELNKREWHKISDKTLCKGKDATPTPMEWIQAMIADTEHFSPDAQFEGIKNYIQEQEDKEHEQIKSDILAGKYATHHLIDDEPLPINMLREYLVKEIDKNAAYAEKCGDKAPYESHIIGQTLKLVLKKLREYENE